MEGRGDFGVDLLKNGLAYEISVIIGDADVTVLAAFDFDQTLRYALFDLVFNAFW